MVKETAHNTYALLIKMAEHIEKLEKENAELRTKLEDDFK